MLNSGDKETKLGRAQKATFDISQLFGELKLVKSSIPDAQESQPLLL